MKHEISFGTVSSGTMRTEDLIPAFVDELLWLDPENSKALEIKNKLDNLDDEFDETNIYYSSEDSDFDLQELFDAMDEICYTTPYCYFGSHPGDGADYGFWIDHEAIEDDVRFGELLSVEDLADVPDKYEGNVIVTNDHGNMTLYNVHKGKTTEVWGIV